MPLSPSLSRRAFLSVTAASIAIPALPVLAAQPVTARVAAGTLRGMRDQGALAFLGVPYAADTAGANRFRAPQPVPAWQGERDATGYGPLAPQVPSTLGKDDPVFEWYYQDQPQGEDCLVLNVFTPDLNPEARRPVMFYIHGGGYINGGGGGEGLNGANLATFGDVVVVTINHRLNAFGFTHLGAHDPDFADAANAGMLDIVAALEWVQGNIAAFGGDPGNVTVLGQSGGGSKIMILLAMPAAQGLFHRAISMSGAAGLAIDPAEDMVPYVDALLAELGVAPDNLAALQDIPHETIIEARGRAVAASFEGARPVIDRRHITTRAMTPEGMAMHASVPLMLGHTETEATLFFRSDMRNFDLTEAQMRARMAQVFGIDDARVDAIMAAYRADAPDMTPSDILIAVASDVQFRLPLTRAAETRSGTAGQAPVWLYDFAWTIPADGGVLGSPHAVDIPFAFGTVDAAGAMVGPGDGPREAALNMMAAFVSFARSGNPNNERMPEWRPFDADSRTTMRIDAQCEPISAFRAAADAEIATLQIDPFNRAALYRYAD
ncbi:carboxylesterase/lipase family protein [Tropicimonas sp.]|uniref:carboxylesterase/lipase family protein n=1 Tax=Tropicimonas sp. TaxID=2067044 RepID=UPI003A8AEE6E